MRGGGTRRSDIRDKSNLSVSAHSMQRAKTDCRCMQDACKVQVHASHCQHAPITYWLKLDATLAVSTSTCTATVLIEYTISGSSTLEIKKANIRQIKRGEAEKQCWGFSTVVSGSSLGKSIS